MKRFIYTSSILICLVSFSQQANTHDSLYIIQDSVLIPTKSGVPISAIIVQAKKQTDPLPAILFYTTYHQGVGDAILGKRSANRGYVGVVAYARGIRSDLDKYAPYENESSDIYDIIEWMSKQSWCNGSVGMNGGSYTGFSQWSAMKNPHPALKTIVPQVAVMPGFDTPMENNVPIGNILHWSHDNIYKLPALPRWLLFEYFDSGIAFRSLDTLAGPSNPIFQKWLDHPSYDAYWQSLVPSPEEYSNIKIPVLSTTGYYDGAQLGALQYYKLHTKYNLSAEHYFVVGPYDHWGGQRKASPVLMDYEIDSVAITNMDDLAFAWLNYILKNAPKPELLKDRFNFQVMGANEWRHAPSMSKINTDTLTFFLSNVSSGDTLKLSDKNQKKGFSSLTVDFKDREVQHTFYTPSIIFDTLDASNGLVFMTEPFSFDFSINGSFGGDLVTTCNKQDMDISLAIYELMPNGKYFFLTRYVGRASYAKDNSKRTLLRPNKKELLPIGQTRFISRQIQKGSRLVALLNINKHPFEIINYGSGKDVSEETIRDAGEPLYIKWHTDSQIRIPIKRD